jgi:hypothetical protein
MRPKNCRRLTRNYHALALLACIPTAQTTTTKQMQAMWAAGGAHKKSQYAVCGLLRAAKNNGVAHQKSKWAQKERAGVAHQKSKRAFG